MKPTIKPILTLFFCFLFIQTSFSDQGIQFFQGEYDQLIIEAKKQNKPYFIEFYADWCAPCKKMERETFRSPRVAKYVNEKYIAYRMDGDQFKTMDIAEKYDVKGFPTIIFFDANSYPIGELTGFKDANQFLAELRKTSNQVF